MAVITRVANLIREQGLEVGIPVELRSTNNVVAWMSPSPVVAKIARDFAASAQEHQVAMALAALGAPAVPPIDIGLAQPINVEGQWVTLWRYVADERMATPAEVADSLFDLHAGLAQILSPADLPPCGDRLEAVVELLDAPEFSVGLSEVDCALLRRALLNGIEALDSRSGDASVIHGSPHRFNVLVSDGRAMFIDFETVEQGPLEWDLAHLEEEVAHLYPLDVDRHLLETCRIAISAATSIWCWKAIERGADMRSHAEQHLDTVRRSLS